MSFLPASYPADSPAECFLQAERNGWQAQSAFRHCMNFVYGWLGHRDAATGLIPRNLTQSSFWNAQDSAADNYPFMVLTCAMLNRELFETTMKRMLETETRLTNRLDNLPDDYDFAKQDFRTPEIDLAHLIFGGSEYVKDGLIPLTEWLGESSWSERMQGIEDSIWKHAPLDTHFGKIPSDSHEVNGEQLQVLCRLYWMHKIEKYREWAFRIADYYFLEHLPTETDYLSLDDHGCEVIDGLAGAYYLAVHTDPQRRERYREPLHRMIDRILEVGMNEDGLVYEAINPKTGEIKRKALSDNWGYDYNAILNTAQLDKVERYYQATKHVLKKIWKNRDYPWENGGSDGYADAIEGGLNLLNRMPLESGFQWVDYSIEVMLNKQQPDGVIEGWHGDGNYARTALMYALWKTQGVYVNPWRADLSFGAVQRDGVLRLVLHGDWNWSGDVIFDPPRHKEFFHIPSDYPRINQFPEWFTVGSDTEYEVQVGGGDAMRKKGSELQKGLRVKIEAKKPCYITVKYIVK